MPRLEDLELKIKQTGDTKATEIQKVANALSKLAEHAQRVKIASKALGEFNAEIKRVKSDKAKAIADTANALAKVASAASNADKATANIKAMSAAFQEMINSIDTGKLSSIASALAEIKSASRTFTKAAIKEATKNGLGGEKPTADIVDAGQTAGAIEETGEAAGEASTKVSGFRAALEGLKYTASKVGSGLKWVGKHALSAGKSLLGMGWDSLKSKVTGLVGGLGNLWHSFARIAGYRALRTAIKAITQGFSQGIEHLYQWSALVGNNFKQSMDSIATSAHYLRDSLGAMASPLIDALAPALEMLVDKFVSLLNVANQFFAALTGKTTWRKAVRTPTEWKAATDDATDSTKKATEAQKKLNKALMDFDEIHLLTTSTTKGSNPKSPSASGNDSGIDSTHFEEVPIASWIQDIKDAIANGDWYGAGKLLADKLNGMLDSFDAKAFGEKIGEKVEHGLKFYLGFMENFKWGTLGIKAGDFINGILSKIDPEDLGHALTAKVRAALSFLSNFAWTVDLSSLGTALGVAFNDLFSVRTMKDLGLTISGFLNNAIHFAASFIGTADFGEAGKNLIDGLVTAITTTDWATAGTTLADFAISIVEFVGNALIEALNHLDDIVGAFMAFAGAFLEKIGDYIHEKFFGWADELNQWFADTFGTNGATGSSVPDSLVGDTSTPVQGKEYDWKVNITPTEDTLATGSWFDKFKGSLDEVNKTKYKAQITDKDGNVKTVYDRTTAIKEKLDQIKKGTYNPKVTFTDNYNTIEKHRKALGKTITTDVNFKTSVVTAKSGSTGGTTKSLLTKSQLVKVLSAYAQGGFPSDDLTQGSLFVAGEMPGQAEMVGNINGKTGVASGKEITGIGDAVRETGANEAALLREQNQLLRQILAKSGSVTLAPSAAAGRWVSQSQAAYARATGV